MKSNKHSSLFQVALICCKCVPNPLHERHLLLLVGYKSILCILSRRKYIVGPSTNAFFSFLGEKYVVGRVQIHLLHFQQKRNTLLHTWYLSRTPRIYSCKFFLAGVNFYRFNSKNWHFRQILREKVAFFIDLTRKIGNLLCILS